METIGELKKQLAEIHANLQKISSISDENSEVFELSVVSRTKLAPAFKYLKSLSEVHNTNIGVVIKNIIRMNEYGAD